MGEGARIWLGFLEDEICFMSLVIVSSKKKLTQVYRPVAWKKALRIQSLASLMALLFTGLINYRKGNLMSAIIAHGTFNSIIFIMNFIN